MTPPLESAGIDAYLMDYLDAWEAGLDRPPGAANPSPAIARELESVRRFWGESRRYLAVSGASDRAEELPAFLGRFRIRKILGRGGHGVVLLAEDPASDELVALKVPRLDSLLKAGMKERFRKEAEAAAGLDHPHIVRVREQGEAGPVWFLVGDYVDGPNLAEWLEMQPDRRIRPVEAARFLITIADALSHCHSRGVIHRDLRPSNILLEPVFVPLPHFAGEGEGDPPLAASSPHPRPLSPQSRGEGSGRLEAFSPKVTDFGLAQVADTTALTRTGQTLGTPAYMAPEQAASRLGPVGPAADIYSLGVILYELLTGLQPFRGATPLDVLHKVLHEDPLPPRKLDATVPRSLEAICLHCLAKQPGMRYASADLLRKDLQAFLDGRSVHAHRLMIRRQFLKRAGVAAAVVGTGGLISDRFLFRREAVADNPSDSVPPAISEKLSPERYRELMVASDSYYQAGEPALAAK